LVPEDQTFRLRLLRLAHDIGSAGHPGRELTYEILTRYWYWPDMQESTNRFVGNCYVCSKIKPSREKNHDMLKPNPISDRRWKDISIDFVIGLPKSLGLNDELCQNLMVVVDRLTKQVHAISINNIIAESIAAAFYQYIWKLHGLPSSIISDRGPQFVSHFWHELCIRLGIQANLSTAFHPQTDGQTERLNAIIEQYLRAYVNYLQDDWSSWILSAEFAINNYVSITTSMTPFFANSGQHPRMGLEPRQFVEEDEIVQRKDRLRADTFAEKIDAIDEYLKAIITYAQATQERYANQSRTNAPVY